MLHSPVDGCLHSGGPCCLHLQRRRWKQQVHPKHGCAVSESSGQYEWSPVTAYIQWQFHKQVSFYLLDRYVSIGYNSTSQDCNHNYILRKKFRGRLRVFENRVLRRIFGPKRDEVTGEWRELHNEERNDLYCSPNDVRVIKLRRMRWAGHVACMGERKGIYRVLVEKPEGKRPLRRPRHRWEDNINTFAASYLNTQGH